MPFNPATARLVPQFDPSARPVNDESAKIVQYGDSGADLHFPASMSNDEIAAILRRDKAAIEARIRSKQRVQTPPADRRSARTSAALLNGGVHDYSDFFGGRQAPAPKRPAIGVSTPSDSDVVDFRDYFGSRR